MKVLSNEGLTELIQLVKDNYVSNNNTNQVGVVSLANVATTGDYNDLVNTPTIPASQVQASWTQTNISAVDYIRNKPVFATVATSGSYNDLLNKPVIPASQVSSDWNATTGIAQIINKPTLATVATTGEYSDLVNTPTIPTINTTTVTLLATSWSSNSQTVNVTGMTANCVALISPIPADQVDYTSAGILCTTQAAGTLTFSCDTIPSNDIDVTVVML